MVYTLPGLRLPAVSSGYSLGCSRLRSHVDRRNPHLSFFLERSKSYTRKSSSGNSYESGSQFSTATASGKILVPGTENDDSSSPSKKLEFLHIVADNSQISADVESSEMEQQTEMEDQEKFVEESSSSESIGGKDSESIQLLDGDVEAIAERSSGTIHEKISDESLRVKERVIPPPGTGRRIYDIDPLLTNFGDHLNYRFAQYRRLREEIDKNEGGLEMFSRGYEKFGFNRSETGITYREWAPGAKWAALIGDFNNWNPNADVMTRNEFGVWEIFLPNNADGSPAIPHGSHVKIRMDTPSGIKDSIPAWIKFSIQAPGEIPYNAIYYDPPEEERYVFKHPRPKKPKSLRIYEAHVGMSSKEPVINTYANFRDEVLPRIKKLGYNAVQIMAIQEHSYYASFGYHVTNFFAPSSRFGTPHELKSLIDKAHELGLLVLMDIVHSHASNNTLDGLNMFDGTDSCYFHSGPRGYHWMWDSRLFNYGHWEVLRFLLSNARWWLDEYKFDGFRFDGVTSMMYTHHGLQVGFTGNYNEYFGYATDVDAMVYLMLVNDLIHGLFPEAITIGEDVSGMPTFCIPVQDGGVGFDYRLHMAIADKWIEILKKRDEDWRMGDIVNTLMNRRWLEKCVAYAESHDQALVGDKTIAFWLMDKDMYDFMALDRPSTPLIDRGIALHKMIRLITMGLGGEGYLNFMGNEFGHPEWIDFPRGNQRLSDGKVIPGNNYSYDKCRRRFDLGDADYLRYHGMQEFDQAMHHLEEKYGEHFINNGEILETDLFMVRDYDPTTRYNFLLDCVLKHRDAIISHLNWAHIFLGCHSFGLYIHNGIIFALGCSQDMFSDTAILQPVFAQGMQNTHDSASSATAPGATATSSPVFAYYFLKFQDIETHFHYYNSYWRLIVKRVPGKGFPFMTSEHQYISRKHEGDRIIVFERGDLVFVFNFHWNNSYSDYRVGCFKPGKYKVVMDSDDPLFGGFGRINHEAEYFTSEVWHDDRPRSFMIYAPSRTVAVYALAEDEAEPVKAEVSSSI